MAGSLRFLFCLGAVGGELTGAAARVLWENLSMEGRLGQQLKRLETAGKIVLLGEGRIDQRVVRITDEGQRVSLAEIDPPARWARGWDRRWRIVAFDIPESSTALRTRLRRRLHACRFGWLQNSVWLSPDPVEEFRAQLVEKDLVPESLTLLEATTVGGESNDAMVASAWDFTALAKSYGAYLDILRLCPGRTRGWEAWAKWLYIEHRAWRQIVRLDPFLPTELLPSGYRGQQAWAARSEAMAVLASAVARLARG